MSDRYRYSRPRSPTFNPARTSLPINISGWASDHHHDHHHSHAIPASRREVLSSNSSRSGSGVVTTYKIKTDPPSRASSTRARRSSTMDSSNRPPAIITTTNRPLRPVIHSGGARPASPMRNPYRSSDEEYYSVPASSQHGHGHHHRKRYSATMDNADMSRLARERDSNRLRVGGGREGTLYVGTRARPAPSYSSSGRRSEVDEYGEDGYGYTGPRDLVQYDLSHSTPRHPSRRDSSEGSRRPTSISGYNDIVPRSYDSRERGPPPSTRGFDRIPDRTSTWGQPAVRMPVVPMAPVERPAPVEPMEPIRRTGSARPAGMYHDNRDPRRNERRDDRYEVRDDDLRRPSRTDTYDDKVEQRGFGIRTDQPDRDRGERSDRGERPERSDRNDRPSRSERDRYGRDYPDEEKSEHKGRDAIAAGMSIAGAALGLTAAKNSISNRDEERDERREDRRRREYEEELRRPRERDERDSRDRDLDPRDGNDRRYREDDRERSPRDYPRDSRDPRDVPPTRDPRDIPPPPIRDSRDVPPPSREPQSSAYVDPTGRDLKDQRPPSRSERDRDIDSSRRDRRLYPDHGSSAIDSRSDASDDAGAPRARRESRSRRESQGAQSFNPRDTMDLKALKDALNAKESSNPPRIPPKEPLSPPHRTPRTSMSRDPKDVAVIRTTLDDERRSRDINSDEGKQLRVVSPPRERGDEKPLKSILRQPRAAFPEDPSPVREGVAPLKDARKDGVPPDARWTKISRKLVNPEALEAGKERYEAREDFVIVLRVLSRDEVQGYAEVTQRIRAAREEAEAQEREERRRARHERHRRERNGELPRRRRRRRDRESGRDGRDGGDSESDTTEDEDYYLNGPGAGGGGDDRVRDAPGGRRRGDDGSAVMSGGLGDGDRAGR